MTRRIELFETENGPALGFDTGLDERAFAQARLAQFITEPGLVAHPGGAVETWKASGVRERNGSMVIWGPAFHGQRLDRLLNAEGEVSPPGAALLRPPPSAGLCPATPRRGAEPPGPPAVLDAIACWMRARLALGERTASLLPFAALIAVETGTVFFAPENLARRCMRAEENRAWISGGEWYIHPDLAGTEAAAFTAAAMLYRALSGTVPFPARDEELLRQDMREGNFPPLRFTAPGLDPKIAGLIQSALEPRTKTAAPKTVSLAELLEALNPAGDGGTAVLFHSLSAGELLNLEKEKERFLKQKNLRVKTRRFVMRNTAIIAGCVAALLIAALTARSIVKSRAEGPSTAGMDSAQVIQTYYNAFGELDHQLMEACAEKGAGKSDIEMVVNLFVITKVRQAYEMQGAPPLISAAAWQESGAGPVEPAVFGVTGLTIERLSGDENADTIRYRAAYTLWTPYQRQDSETETAAPEPRQPQSLRFSDELTLAKKRGNWRITEINRSEL